MWPNGDPEKLRGLGSAWRTAAEELRRASDATNSAWTDMEELASDEVPQALAQMDGVDSAAHNVADQFDTLASACGEWASTIQDAHQSVIDIVGTAIVAGTIAGAVAGFFTLGVGTVAVYRRDGQRHRRKCHRRPHRSGSGVRNCRRCHRGNRGGGYRNCDGRATATTSKSDDLQRKHWWGELALPSRAPGRSARLSKRHTGKTAQPQNAVD